MARLPYVDSTTALEPVRQVLERLPVRLNIFGILAHATTNLRPVLRLGSAILSEQKLDAKLRELAILHVAKLSGAPYEWVQHVSIAKAVGATQAEIDALDRGDLAAACFGEAERLVLRFTTEVVREVRARDETFAAMTVRFTAQEIVELLLAIGFYMMMARVMETTAIDLEPSAGDQIVDGLKRGLGG
jgi:alkylhydroperoxidase family enzyme